MGSSASQEDQEPLLQDDEETQPLFEKLKLVLIGSQGAGKNTVGNAILREKIFTMWTSFKSSYVKETRTVSGTRIDLARTPGWKGNLSRSEKTKREIVHCVQSLYNTGPHAVLLALSVNSESELESTIHTLESLFTDKLWDHTIVLFTNGEKLGHYTIEDHIRYKQLQPLIDKCGQRYFVVQKKDSNQITDTIEELVAKKNSARCFKLSALNEVDANTLMSDWIDLVARVKSKITSISNFKEKLCINHNSRNNNSVTKILKSKDDEIERLKNIVQEKEWEIERLQSRCQDGLDLSQRIAELEHQLEMKCKEVEEKDTEIGELKKQLQIWKTIDKERRTHEDQRPTAHTDVRCPLDQDVNQVSTGSYPQIQLCDLPSNSSAPPNWGDTLLEILEMLSNVELKKMKFFLSNNKEYRMPMNLEETDIVDLAKLMLKQWRERLSVRITRDLIKKIPRNDDDMMKLFAPFLEKYEIMQDETW